jgi:hypothetical protein
MYPLKEMPMIKIYSKHCQYLIKIKKYQIIKSETNRIINIQGVFNITILLKKENPDNCRGFL